MRDQAALPLPPVWPRLAPSPDGQLGEDLLAVEELLLERLAGPIPLLGLVGEHLVGAGGKRLRPRLCLLAARATAVAVGSARRAAAAAELMHSASLLHDDVVDEAVLRRGRPAAPRLFGNSACVLVGDALLSSALLLLAEIGDPQALRSSVHCVRRMALGEVAQLVGSRQPGRLGLLGLMRVIEGKTSALLAWCSTVGDLCPAPLRSPLRRFGRRLGVAFQIGDDILDVEGDPRCTGKEPGADLRTGRLTLPVILACARRPRLRQAIAAMGPAPTPDIVSALLREIGESGGIEEARAAAGRLLGRAHRALDELPPSVWRQELHRLADGVLERRD